MKVKRLVAVLRMRVNSLCQIISLKPPAVDRGIDDAQLAAVKIRAEINRAHQRRQRLSQQLNQIDIEIPLWKKRAFERGEATANALACVNVLRRFELRRQHSLQAIKVQDGLLFELNQILQMVECKLAEIECWRNASLAAGIPLDKRRLMSESQSLSCDDSLFRQWENIASRFQDTLVDPESAAYSEGPELALLIRRLAALPSNSSQGSDI